MQNIKFISLLLFILLSSCGGDSSSGDGNPDPKKPNEGGISVDDGQTDETGSQGSTDQDVGSLEEDGGGDIPDTGESISDQAVNAELVYRPLTEMFDDVSTIMTSPDIAATLIKLRSLASPTLKYHRDLESLILAAKNPSMEHINMLIDAMYYNESQFSKMKAQYKHLFETGDAYTSESQKLVKKFEDARSFASTFEVIINKGFVKASDLSFENGLETIKKIYWANSHEAFERIEEISSEFNKEQKETIMILASEKGAPRFASRIGIEYFKEYTDKSLLAFHGIIDQLQMIARYYFMIDGFNEFQSFTHDQVIDFVKKSNFSPERVAVDAYLKSQNKSHENVLIISGLIVSNHDKSYFIKNIVQTYGDIETSQILDLCNIAETACPATTEHALKNWKDPSIESSTTISDKLQYTHKDTWILGIIHYFDTLSNTDAHQLVISSFSKKKEAAIKTLNAIQDISSQGVLAIANELIYGDKDVWLLAAVDKLKEITADEFYKLVAASFNKKVQVADNAFSLVKDKSTQNVIKVASLMRYGDKDLWINRALSDYTGINAKAFKALLQAAFNDQLEIAEHHLEKVTDLTPTEAASVAKDIFKYGNIDKWLDLALAKWTSISEDDAFTIIKVSFNPNKSLAEKILEKLTTISPSSVSKISTLFIYSGIDDWILLAIDKVTEVNISEVIDILNKSYSKSPEIGISLLKKMNRVTVADVVRAADVMRYSNKATLILAMLDSIVDLSLDDIPTLRNAASSSRDEIERAIRLALES